ACAHAPWKLALVQSSQVNGKTPRNPELTTSPVHTHAGETCLPSAVTLSALTGVPEPRSAALASQLTPSVRTHGAPVVSKRSSAATCDVSRYARYVPSRPAAAASAVPSCTA